MSPRRAVARVDEDEAALAEAIRQGDERAYEAVFRTHYAGLCDWAERYLRSADAAEEVVQDVLYALWAARGGTPVTGSLTHYLYTAVRNKSFNRLRRLNVEMRYAADAMPALVSDDVRDESIDDARAAALDHAIAQLSPARRELFLMRWRHQLSYAEIGELTGRSVKAVEVQLYRILNVLREAVRQVSM